MSSLTKKEMEVLSSPTFQQIINQHLENPSRRNILKGSVGVAALGFLGLAGCGGGDGVFHYHTDHIGTAQACLNF